MSKQDKLAEYLRQKKEAQDNNKKKTVQPFRCGKVQHPVDSLAALPPVPGFRFSSQTSKRSTVKKIPEPRVPLRSSARQSQPQANKTNMSRDPAPKQAGKSFAPKHFEFSLNVPMPADLELASLPNIDTGRSNLMEEIRKGGTLRHVSPEKINKMVPDSRGELMDQIRQGVSLKKVDSTTLEQEPLVSETTPGIAGMLQRALQERGVAMGLSSSEGEDSGDNEEWDD